MPLIKDDHVVETMQRTWCRSTFSLCRPQPSEVLFVFIVLRHERRRIVHFNVTEHPSAEWTAQQMVDAFPWDTAPRYLVRDRDQTYGAYFDTRVDGLGIEQVLTAPRSPWQNPFVERMIGSIRRECSPSPRCTQVNGLADLLRFYHREAA